MPLYTLHLGRKFRFEFAVALIAAMGLALALYSTSLGIGTDADTPTYLMAAHSLLTGNGLTVPTIDGRRVPMTSFPPLLPIVLAGFEFTGLNPLAAARWLNAFLFATDILLVGFLVRRYTQSDHAAFFAAFVTATTVDVLFYYCFLVSEPLFLSFAFAGLILLALYLERPSFPLLFLFSAAFALAGATRYAGVSLLPIGAAAIVFGALPSRRRWLHLAAFITFFGAPLAWWALRNLTLVQSLSNRTLAFHPPHLDRFEYSYLSLSTWVLPFAVPQVLRVLALSAAILFLFRPLLGRFRTSIAPRWSFYDVAMLFVASYLLLFVISQTYFDAQIWIAGRHLLAVYLVGLVIVVCQVKELLDKSNHYFRAACALLCLVAAGVSTVRIANNAVRLHREGIGLSSSRWQTSALAAKVRELDTDTALISNSGSILYLLTGRLAHDLPDRVDSQTRRSRPQYGAEMDRMKQRLQHDGGVVVVFTDFASDTESSERELEQQLDLQRLAVTNDGYLLAKPARD